MEINRAFRVGPIRPPSEAESLLIQVTKGCTWNKCKFCTVYKGTQFKAFSADSVKADIDNIRWMADKVLKYKSADGNWDINGVNYELGCMPTPAEQQCFYMVANWLINGRGENVFLQDGNTTALSSGRLTDVLVYLKEAFPNIKRITSYGRAENLSKSSAEEFKALKEAGLDRIHAGYESGSDAVLTRCNKGVTQEQEIIAGKNVKAGGIELSAYFMPGLGGKDLSQDNAEGMAYVINQIDPDFVRIRTAAVKPGTELYDDYMAGVFEMASDDEKILEVRKIIELADGVNTRIVSDHMVNLLQLVEGHMVNDREKLLGLIDEYLEMDELHRKIYQLARRKIMVIQPSDLASLGDDKLSMLMDIARSEKTEKGWNELTNSYLCKYI